ncbi:MAG TPA: glycosyl transferase family 2 [Bacteroidales bacterium]|nr:glycosyl transferase family 2 [Bacteroidales bacterium]
MLNVSIVLYNPDWENEVLPLVGELLKVQCLNKLYLVDNSEKRAEESVWGRWKDGRVQYVFPGKNTGYGRGHNMALRESVHDGIRYHLVMNADIAVRAEDIDRLCRFMENRPDVGQLMPKVVYPNGELQYLCKLLPTPMDVFGRRFLPQRWTKTRNARYELRDSGYNTPMNVPYLSGCFMLLRTEAAQKAGLFDERYFMYPEDIDLTRRIHHRYVTLYYPEVTIVHKHKKGSYHSMNLLWIHIVNMCRYFNKWGWFFDRERKEVNRTTLSSTDKPDSPHTQAKDKPHATI